MQSLKWNIDKIEPFHWKLVCPLKFFYGGMLIIAKIFFGFGNLPSYDTMYPKMTLE
jgi:hypothetical protein